MVKITQYHQDAYEKFIKDYGKKFNKNSFIVDEEVDYFKAIENYFPQIEVHFKNGQIFTVNRVDEEIVNWAEGEASKFKL